jgi:hypothetical protein
MQSLVDPYLQLGNTAAAEESEREAATIFADLGIIRTAAELRAVT